MKRQENWSLKLVTNEKIEKCVKVVLRQNFVGLRWKLKAVSMVLFVSACFGHFKQVKLNFYLQMVFRKMTHGVVHNRL